MGFHPGAVEQAPLHGGRVAFLLQKASHPRYYRRIQAWLEEGWDVTVYHFQRGDGDQVPDLNAHSFSTVRLGAANDGAYVRRVLQLVTAGRIIRRNERGRTPPAFVYCFGWDMTTLGMRVFPRSRRLAEIADIRLGRLRTRRLGRTVLGFAEGALAKRLETLVLTSPGFLGTIPQRGILGTRTIVHENRVPPASARQWHCHPPAGRPLVGSGVTVGVIGTFRYPFALVPFLDAAADLRDDGISVELFGTGTLTKTIEEYSRRFGNIRYHGRFDALRDLPRIYGSVDIVFSVYDNRDYNVRIALPNKLYEAVFFGVPIVVASDTALAERVEEWGVGWSVDPRRPGWAHDWILGLTPEAIHTRRQAAFGVPKTDLVSDERGLVAAITSR